MGSRGETSHANNTPPSAVGQIWLAFKLQHRCHLESVHLAGVFDFLFLMDIYVGWLWAWGGNGAVGDFAIELMHTLVVLRFLIICVWYVFDF